MLTPRASRPAALWGTEARLNEPFAGAAREIRTTRRAFGFRYESPEHWLEVFRTCYGPVQKAFGALPPERQGALEGEILALLRQHDREGDRGLVVPSEYLEAVIVRA